MVRSVSAVVAGLAVMFVVVMAADAVLMATLLPSLTADPTPAFLAANLVVAVVAGLLGGFVAALIARRAPLWHAVVLAALVLSLGVVCAFLPQDPGMGKPPGWYHWVVPIIGFTGVLIGGVIRVRPLRPR